MEPMMDSANQYKAIVSNRTKKSWEVMDINQIFNTVGEDDGNELVKFFIDHSHDWKYPSVFHPMECLGYSEGREKFSPLDGNYVDRMKRVASRIIAYLQKHIYLTGTYDMELITGFIISTYYMEMFSYAPRLLIRGPTNSGKSTLLDILGELCYRGNTSGDTTEAAIFRMIHFGHVTPLLDEFQDYSHDAQNGIKKILKNGNTRGRSVQRVEKIGNRASETKTYDIFAPVAFINQVGGKAIAEEVINRSMTITMFARPDFALPMMSDSVELEEIRNELYTIRAMWIADRNLVGFDMIHKKAIMELQDPNGVECDSKMHHFSNRCRDILGTMYTVAKMSGMEYQIITAFEEIQVTGMDDERDSSLSMVFTSIVRAMENFMEDNPMFTNFMQALQQINTRDIADIYRDLMLSEGEISMNMNIATRTVTNQVKGMGFNLTRCRKDNSSLLSPKGLDLCFQMNLMKYGTEDAIKKYSKKDSQIESTQSRMVNEQLNNLTTVKG